MVDKNALSNLKSWIDSVPLVDIHSHLNGEHPAAEDPKEIIFYHYIVTELISAGAPPEVFSQNLSFEDAMKRALPYFKLIRNTSTHWCLMKMLRDLYGFEGEEINQENWRDLRDAILSHAEKRDWYKKILEKTGLKKGFLTFSSSESVLEGLTKVNIIFVLLGGSFLAYKPYGSWCRYRPGLGGISSGMPRTLHG